ncbi:MAG: glycosyltransferase [Gammaproteobacteria bacterium]|nr:glycosyltransferase [Bacteroidetes Order II. bacterium]MBT6585665.1 glycosyltransferase [Gammaproteobacteria bacterium]MBT7878876.1 glycosyltransferase [Gammaproteobacteria bacterium]
MKPLPITAIVTAYNRPNQTIETIERLQACMPVPDQVLVHVDGNQQECYEALRNAFPRLDIILSIESVGPGGGRNKLVAAARHPLIASFDDDSYPIDECFFSRVAALSTRFPEVSLFAASVYHFNQQIEPDERVSSPTSSFGAGGVAFRKNCFLEAGGFVPLVVAYGMEEEDLSLRMLNLGKQLIQTPWLRVFHDTDLGHHADVSVNSAVITNLALLAWLRYPIAYFPYSGLQIFNRLLWCLRVGRIAGLLQGLLAIPNQVRKYRRAREPVSITCMRRRNKLRRRFSLQPFSIDLAANFIVCQIGSREQYSFARTLRENGQLKALLTDVWVKPGSFFVQLPGKLGERFASRFHLDLKETSVVQFNFMTLVQRLRENIFGVSGKWEKLIARNQMFESRAASYLHSSGLLDSQTEVVVLAYSYAAHDILVAAKRAGAKTILCQIDGGEADEQLIEQLMSDSIEKAPSLYWRRWREECRLADAIIVNSEWSRNLLIKANVEAEKLVKIPVIYEPPVKGLFSAPHYPNSFDAAHPLQVLYLGALIQRKGVMEILEAARMMVGLPVQFTFVGSNDGDIDLRLFSVSNVVVHDRVPRTQVYEFFSRSNVLVFPTYSDGFGLVQLEALACGLPVIASRNCAELVSHGVTGFLLGSVSCTEVVDRLKQCLEQPSLLADMSVKASLLAHQYAVASKSSLVSLTGEVGNAPY